MLHALQALFSRATGNSQGGLINKRNGGQTVLELPGFECLRQKPITPSELEKKRMSQIPKTTARVRNLFVAALMLACTLGTATHAVAQKINTPPTPARITPPVGNIAFLFGHGVGTQGYICLPTSDGATTAAWNANNARPEATLSVNISGQQAQIITHFLSPDDKPNTAAPSPLPVGIATWQSSSDSSEVWAQKVNTVAAGTDASCPNNNSIACLLLQSIGNEEGPTGGTTLAKTTYIQRLNTKGGLAPADGCVDFHDVGKQALVPYSADYYFFRGGE
jgi:hypothetical protein